MDRSGPTGESTPKWAQWTRSRILGASLALAGVGIVVTFLAIGGALLLDPLLSSPSSFEKTIGTLMVLGAMLLLVAAPLTILNLRRTWPWRLATIIATLAGAWFGLLVFWDSFPLSP